MGKTWTDEKLDNVFETRWTRVLGVLKDLIAEGERDLSRIVHQLRSRTEFLRLPGELVGALAGVPFDDSSLAAKRMARSWLVDTLVETAWASTADALIVPGAGWGGNLFDAWLRGGPQIPAHALELSAAGREACALISATVPIGPDVSVRDFNFRTPDFGDLAGRYQRPLVFTNSSIDKVVELPAAYIDQVLALAPVVNVLSVEAIPHQFMAEGALDRIPYEDVPEPNRNFLSVLRDYERRGLIVIEETRPRVLNRSSLIRWSKRV